MNLPELIAAARAMLDDPDVGGDERDLLWSDDELVRWINEAQQEAARRAYLLFDDTSSITQVQIDSSGNRFPVNQRVIRVNGARLIGGIHPYLIPANEDELDIRDPQWGKRQGEPTRYVNRDKHILLDRIPTGPGVIQLEAYILPSELALGVNETLDIDPQHHEALLYWVKYRAYDKDDTETKNAEKSAIGSNQFTSRFGRRRDASEEVTIRSAQARRSAIHWF